MADLNFTAGLDTSQYVAGLSKMTSSTNRAAQDISKSLSQIALEKNLKDVKVSPKMDLKDITSGTAQLMAMAKRDAKAIQDAYKVKPTFVTERNPSASGMAGMAKIPTLGDLGAVAGKSSVDGLKSSLTALNGVFATTASGAAGMASSIGSGVKTAFNSVSDSTARIGPATREAMSGLRDIGAQIKKNADVDAPSFRYAMYDVASSLQQISGATLNAGKAVITMSAQYETAFTAIERTTMAGDESLMVLKNQFMALSHEIPLAFAELTRIGSLGAQMGIADSELSGFTKTVAEFSATTNVSIDSAAQSFGALKNLLDIDAEGFRGLGSAVAYVGINSVATETEVLSVATAISGVGAQAGLTKEYTIGLSGALASLRVPAEQSRGALTRTFQEINRAAAEGGQTLQNFAGIMGMSAEEAKALAASDMGAFFTRFNQGLSGLNAQQLTTALDSVNLSDVRVTNTLARLSTNMDIVNKSMADSAYGFENSGVLSALYAEKAEDLASRMQILISSLQELGAKLGDAVSPTFGAFVDWLAKRVQDLSVALSTQAGKSLAAFAGIIGAVTTVVFGLAGAIALATATTAAFSFVSSKLGLTGIATSLRAVTAGWVATTFSTGAATVATNLFKIALVGIPIVGAIVLLTTLASAFGSVGTSAEASNAAFSNMVADTSGLASAMAADKAAYDAALASGNQAVVDSFVAVDTSLNANSSAHENHAETIRNTADVLGLTVPAIDAQNDALASNIAWLGDNTRAWIKNQLIQSETFQNMAGNAEFMNYFNALGGNMDDVINAAAADGQAGVINYFKKLEQTGVNAAKIASGKISSAFDVVGNRMGQTTQGRLKSGPWASVSNSIGDLGKSLPGLAGAMKLAGNATTEAGTAADSTAGAWDNAGKSADDAAKKVYTLVDYASDLAKIYERAFDIRFSSGQTLDKITTSFSKIAKATADARDEIDGLNADINKLNADKALQEYFLGVAEAYGDTLRAQEIRANLSKIDSDLTAKTKLLQKAQDKTNKTLIGSTEAAIDNRSEILSLVSSYQDHIKALASSGMSQEQLRIKTAELKQDFINQATQLGYNVTELGTYAAAFDDVTVAIDNIPRNITVTANTNPALQALNEFEAKATALGNKKYGGGTVLAPAVQENRYRLNWKATLDPSDVGMTRRALDKYNPGNYVLVGRELYKQEAYADGGYVSGPGTARSDSINAKLSNGEFVINAAAVSKYGVGFFNQLNQMQSPQFYSGGMVGGSAGGASSAPTMVELSPYDRKLLAAAGNVQLRLDGKVVAQATNQSNFVSAQRGTN